MKRVSVITRAYNRLEYTIKCVNSVRDNTNYLNYKHLIVNNNSNDGTQQWLNWIKDYNSEWFPNLTSINLNENKGDWGGLIEGTKYSSNSDYIVQLDNDMEVEPNWLLKLVDIVENISEKIVQVRRFGTHRHLRLKNARFLITKLGKYYIGTINRPVGCFIVSLKDFNMSLPHIDNNRGGPGKTELSKYLGGTIKTEDIRCYLIDGGDKDCHVNDLKYPKKNKQCYVKQ